MADNIQRRAFMTTAGIVGAGAVVLNETTAENTDASAVASTLAAGWNEITARDLRDPSCQACSAYIDMLRNGDPRYLMLSHLHLWKWYQRHSQAPRAARIYTYHDDKHGTGLRLSYGFGVSYAVTLSGGKTKFRLGHIGIRSNPHGSIQKLFQSIYDKFKAIQGAGTHQWTITGLPSDTVNELDTPAGSLRKLYRHIKGNSAPSNPIQFKGQGFEVKT